jgi:hypothetical protein
MTFTRDIAGADKKAVLMLLFGCELCGIVMIFDEQGRFDDGQFHYTRLLMNMFG